MSTSQTTQLFAAFFAFFGCHFFLGAEAHAQSLSSSQLKFASHVLTETKVEAAQRSFIPAADSLQEFNGWDTSVLTVSPGISFLSVATIDAKTSSEFHIVPAKEFYLRTGLSPPCPLFI